MTKAEKLTEFYSKASPFKEGTDRLREFLQQTELEENWKWSFPTYTLNGKNVVGVASFKHYFGLWFFNGVLLSDPKNLLHNAQEGKTKAMRHLKFKAIDDLDMEVVKNYVNEAITHSREGKTVTIIPTPSKMIVTTLLKEALMNDEQLQIHYDALPQSKQLEFNTYIAEAKREDTKQRRLEKSITLILNDQGLNDTYK